MEGLEYRVGRFTLKPFRQLLEDGRPVAIGRKPLDLLSVLAKAQGALVTKDELMTAVWPKTIVEDNAIQVHIAALRKVLGSDAGLLSTVHGLGYRLVVVQSAPAGARAEAVAESAGTGRKFLTPARLWLAAVAAVIVLAGAGAAGYWLLQPTRHWTVDGSRPFITTLALEDYPAFSPDGAMLAYSSGPAGGTSEIRVRPVADGDSVRISDEGGHDVSPSWSSDGAHIAYAAEKTGEPCRILVASVPGGKSREAGRCGLAETTTLCWQPKSNFVYFTDATASREGTIDRLDVETGARQRLLHGGVAVVGLDAPADPQCSPDGKFLSYRVLKGTRINAFYILDLESGVSKALARIASDTFSETWSEDGRALLISEPGPAGSAVIAYPVDGGASYQVYATAAKTGRLSAGAGGHLALETDASRFNLARVQPTQATQPDIIDTADGMTWSPTFAPDGTLAFLSNRSGEEAIWTMKPGQAPSVLLNCGTQVLRGLRWSPDGSKLALVVPLGPQKIGITVRILTAAGAGVTSFDLPSFGFGNPNWTLDSKSVIGLDVTILRSVQTSLAEPSKHVPITPPVPKNFRDWAWDGVVPHGDGLYSIRIDRPGIWDISKQPRLVTGKYPAANHSPLAFLGDDVLVPEYDKDTVRIFAQPLSGGPDRLIGYAPGARDMDAYFASDFTVNPKTGEIVYVAAVVRDTNIDLLTLARR